MLIKESFIKKTAISDKITVKKEEVLEYKNAFIYFIGEIISYGTLIFDNCLILCDESTKPGHISVLEGSISIKNSIIMFASNEERSFIYAESDKIELIKCKLVNCNNFISGTAKQFTIDLCILQNCSYSIVNIVADKIQITKNIILNEKLPPKEDIVSLFSLMGMGDCYIGYNTVVQSDAYRNALIKHNITQFIFCTSEENTKIENCTFIDTDYCITGNLIQNCKFYRCKNIIMNGSINPQVENCVFECCFEKTINVALSTNNCFETFNIDHHKINKCREDIINEAKKTIEQHKIIFFKF